MHLSANDDAQDSTVATENGQRVFHRVVKVLPDGIAVASESFHQECESIKHIVHPCLPRLLREFVDGNRFTMVFDYAGGVSLWDYVTSVKAGTPSDIPLDI